MGQGFKDHVSTYRNMERKTCSQVLREQKRKIFEQQKSAAKEKKTRKAAIYFYLLTDRNSLWLLLMRLFSPIPKQTLSASSRCYYFSGNLEWPTAPKSRVQHRTTPRKRSSFLRWGERETLWGSVIFLICAYLIHNLARWPVHRPPASPASAAISSIPPTILPDSPSPLYFKDATVSMFFKMT